VLDGARVVDDAGFEGGRVAVDGVLDEKRIAALLYLWQVWDEGADVLGPEDEAIDLRGREINGVDLSPVGVDHFAETNAQAVHEPCTVECWDVCFVARGDDHMMVFLSFMANTARDFFVQL
jgi:hypothetical protein